MKPELNVGSFFFFFLGGSLKRGVEFLYELYGWEKMIVGQHKMDDGLLIWKKSGGKRKENRKERCV